MLRSINPYTEEELYCLPSASDELALQAVHKANEAFKHWRATRYQMRARTMLQVAERLSQSKTSFAKQMAMEMGKPIEQGRAEVDKAVYCIRHYASHAEAILKNEEIVSDASCSYVTYQPLGVLLGILPWNFPVWLAFRFLAPALMAGNTCLIKHDPHTQGSAAMLNELFAETDLVTNLPIQHSQIPAIIDHPIVKAVSFTGSTKGGKAVAELAGRAVKPSVLELGGSDAFIVLADADLALAAETAVRSRMGNAGQSCIAAKRILVERAVYQTFLSLCHQALNKIKLGDPQNEDTQMGPLARKDLLDIVKQQVQLSIQQGARCLLGGRAQEGPGYFYLPTLLADVTVGMPVFQQEVFGPVLAVAPFDSLDEAMALANHTEYGLGASIWTNNASYVEQAILQLDVGQVAVNGMVKTDPRLPSGGVKASGYGRELGPHGIKAFVNIKQVWLA